MCRCCLNGDPRCGTCGLGGDTHHSHQDHHLLGGGSEADELWPGPKQQGLWGVADLLWGSFCQCARRRRQASSIAHVRNVGAGFMSLHTYSGGKHPFECIDFKQLVPFRTCTQQMAPVKVGNRGCLRMFTCSIRFSIKHRILSYPCLRWYGFTAVGLLSEMF